MYRTWLKPFIDQLLTVIALIVLSPAILVLALVVALRMGRPVLFRQTRIGLGNRPFQFVKFRTMTDKRDNLGQLLPDDVRLTATGRLLRSTSLDELPQLWNVLMGDMSLIGPRPLLPEYLPLYSPEQRRRHLVKPGITGWAQVNGRNGIGWEQKFSLDVWYVENCSFKVDLQILFATIVHVFQRRGISQEGHATMERFTGQGGQQTNTSGDPRG